MRVRLLFLLSLTAIASLPLVTSAQQYLGVATDGWSGMNTLYINPANIAGREDRITVNLFSLNIAIDNNLGTFSKLDKISTSLSGKEFNSIFTNAGNSSFSMIAPSVTVRGPGLLMSLGERHGLALTTGIRGVNQFNNFDQSLYRTISNANYQSGTDYNYRTKQFNWTAQMWSEVGLTYAVVLVVPGEHQLNAGVTLRYYGGIGFLSLKGYNLNLNYKADSNLLRASQSDIEFASNVVSTDAALSQGIDASSLTDQFTSKKAGSGFGGDVGLTYFYRPDNASGNGYRFRLAVSATDIGVINYKAGNTATVKVNGSGIISGIGLAENTRDYRSFRNYAVSQGFRADTTSKDTRVYLPTLVIASMDFQIYRRFYLNASYYGNAVSREEFGNSYYDKAVLIPRYDSRIFSIGLPISYSRLASDIKVGLGIRITGLFFGSDDMMALFNDKQHGFNFYAGGYVPIYKKKKKAEKSETSQRSN